jgi:MFS family permease
MTKMIADWFAGKEIATAMAIFVNSWPTGIGISLLTLPAIGTAYGVSAVYLAVATSIAVGIIILAATSQPPANASHAAVTSARLDRHAVIAVIAAGLTWGLFNVGFATIFSFGPTLLVERGWSITSAGSTISIVLWLAVFSVPFGGWLADRTGRPQFILVAASVLFALLMVALARSGAAVLIAIGLGMFGGQPAGPIMSLPARVLQPSTRAIGMGLFYTVYYAAMMLGPVIGGGLAKWTGTAATAFDFGAAMVLACPLLVWVFNRIAAARTHSA